MLHMALVFAAQLGSQGLALPQLRVLSLLCFW